MTHPTGIIRSSLRCLIYAKLDQLCGYGVTDMQDNISGWVEWADAFAHHDHWASAAELHGLITGILSVSQAPTSSEWQTIFAVLKMDPFTPKALQLLVDEADDIAALLAEDDMDFNALLPDDEHPLSERMQALADWASGLLLGFGLAGGIMRADEDDLLNSVQQISQVDAYNVTEDDENEQQYTELLEFMRLVPVSLALGRKKQTVAKMALLMQAAQQANPAHQTDAHVFDPTRPINRSLDDEDGKPVYEIKPS